MDSGEAGTALLLPPILWLHLHVCIHVSNNNITFHYWHDETRATNIIMILLCYYASKQSIKFHTGSVKIMYLDHDKHLIG